MLESVGVKMAVGEKLSHTAHSEWVFELHAGCFLFMDNDTASG